MKKLLYINLQNPSLTKYINYKLIGSFLWGKVF